MQDTTRGVHVQHNWKVLQRAGDRVRLVWWWWLVGQRWCLGVFVQSLHFGTRCEGAGMCGNRLQLFQDRTKSGQPAAVFVLYDSGQPGSVPLRTPPTQPERSRRRWAQIVPATVPLRPPPPTHPAAEEQAPVGTSSACQRQRTRRRW
eukprot:gene17091-biopygen18853